MQRNQLHERKVLLLFSLLLLLVLLTSCAKGEAHLKIHRDRTADLDMRIFVDKQTLDRIGQSNLPERLADVLQMKGIHAVPLESDGQTGLQVTQHVDLKMDVNQASKLPEGVEIEQSEDKKFFYTAHRLAVTIHMDQLLSAAGSSWTQRISSMPFLAKKLIEQQMKFDLLITFPLKFGESNADIRQDGGKTLGWHVKLFDDNRFEMRFAVPNIRNIAYTAGPALFLVSTVIVYAVIRRRKKRKDA